MTAYDPLAADYDGYFSRPVDRWEDARLAALLAPHVNGRAVLDLGCGTGWLLDHLSPGAYCGADSSAAMLAVLAAKHRRPHVGTVKTEIGTPGWRGDLPSRRWDTITATWAVQYLGAMRDLLPELLMLVRPGGVIALHGYLPRYAGRGHLITRGLAAEAPPCLHPGQVRADSRTAGLPMPRCRGTGALPDSLAGSRLAWRAAAALAPPRWHYAALWTWRAP